MTARPIAPVIPAASRSGHRKGRLRAAGPLPLASAPNRTDVIYGFGRIDASGRVADRVIISALGWRGGDRLTLTAGSGVMVARRDPDGMVIVPARPYIVIPAAVRRRCGLRAGDRVLLAALPGEDALAAYSFAVVDQAIRAHGPSRAVKGGSRDYREPRRAPGHTPPVGTHTRPRGVPSVAQAHDRYVAAAVRRPCREGHSPQGLRCRRWVRRAARCR